MRCLIEIRLCKKMGQAKRGGAHAIRFDNVEDNRARTAYEFAAAHDGVYRQFRLRFAQRHDIVAGG